MSATIDTPVLSVELDARVLPLPESRPESPNKIDEATATSPVSSAAHEPRESVTVQAAKSDAAAAAVHDDDAKSDNSPIGSNRSNCGSCRPTTSVDSEGDRVEQCAADKSESADHNEEGTEADVTKIGQHVNNVKVSNSNAEAGKKKDIPTEKIDQSVDRLDAKRKSTTRHDRVLISADNQLTSPVMDPNDTENNGNVAKNFFTNEIKARCLSPIHEHESVSLKFSKMADLFIKATGPNGRAYIFQVHSAILEASSTVFYDMIYTTNTRGNKEEWVWELEDSAIGLKVMFSLLHLNYCAPLFTQEPNSYQVHEVLRVLAKFNIRDEAFHPFVKSWVSGFRKGLNNTSLTQLERLYSAYKLGDFQTLKMSIRKVAHEVELSEDGTVLLDKKPIQEVVPITDELVANIRAIRSMDLKNVLEPLKDAYDTLMGDADDRDPTDFCKSLDGHDECNEKLLGSLLGNLRRQKLRPVPAPVTYTDSFRALAEKVSQMDIRGLIVPNLEPHKQRHGRCKLGQDDVAKQLLECKPYLPIYDDLVEKMVITSKRSGTDKDVENEFEDYKEVFNNASIKYDLQCAHNFWGWNEDAKTSVCKALLPTEDSGIAREDDFKERKVSMEIAASVVGTV